MKILYVVNDFFPHYYGGVERYVLNISKHMQRMGNSVKVLTYGMDSLDNGYMPSGKMLSREYDYEGIPVMSIRHEKIPADIGFRLDDPEIEASVLPIIKEEAPDIIHMAHPMKFGPVVALAKRLSIPIVITLTDFWLLCPRGRFFKPDYSPCNSPKEGNKCRSHCGVAGKVKERYVQARKIFMDADRLVAPSRFIIGIFRDNGWERDIRLIRHGIDYTNVEMAETSSRPETSEVVFGYTGVVTGFKGVGLLVDAFKQVRGDNIKLRIYGDTYSDWVWERSFLEGLQKSVAEDGRISLMGRYTHDELPKIFNSIDINVIPSSTLESYGLVLTESLSHGVPVIASDIVGSGYEYIENGSNGFIFKVNEPDTLREIIEKISSEPSIVEGLRKNVFAPPRIEEEAFELENLYSELC